MKNITIFLLLAYGCFHNANIISMEKPAECSIGACLVVVGVEDAAFLGCLGALEEHLKQGVLKKIGNQKYNDGNTLLHLIIQSPCVNLPDEGEYADFIKRLLETTGIKASAVNNQGKTALDIALKKGLNKIGEVLIKALAQEHSIARALEAEQGLPRELGKKIFEQ